MVKHCPFNKRYKTFSAKSSWFVKFYTKAISERQTDPLRMRHMTYPSLPINDFGYWPQVVFRGVGSDIFQFAFKGPVESPTPKWNILTYLPTTTRGLTKNLKNFQAPLHWYFDQDILGCLLMVSCPILNLIVHHPSDLALKTRATHDPPVEHKHRHNTNTHTQNNCYLYHCNSSTRWQQFTNLLWWHIKWHSSEINFLIGVNARQNEKQTWNNN